MAKQQEHNDSDIAIVGMSCLFPGAPNIDVFWRNLEDGVDSIVEAPSMRIDPLYFQKGDEAYDRFYCNRGGFLDIPALDPMKYGFLPIAAKGMEPEHLCMMKLAWDALEDAGVFEKNIPLESGCVIIGKGNFGNLSSMRNMDIINTSEQVVRVVRACVPGISEEELAKIRKEYQAQKGEIRPDTAIALMPNLIAALVTNKLNMHGPAYTVDGACASSTIAIDHASGLLRSGQCDIALAAGLHIAQSAMFQASFNMLGAISHKGVISPFSEDADGLLPSEGAGVLVLKTMKKALADGDRIYAVIRSSAVFSDGAGVSVMAPNTEGQQLTIARAWEKTNLDPRRVGLIEAHGTATLAGDKAEINTLNEFFGMDDPSLNKIWLGSVKSNIGHTMPAAGMAGVIKVALALYHRRIPPTLHAEKPAKALSGSRLELPQTAMDWDGEKYPLVAGVNAFGFGGINSHLVMTAWDNEPENLAPNPKLALRRSLRTAHIAAADTKEELLEKIDRGLWIGSKGRWRLVVFDPTEERIARARKIVEKGKPWKGRLDIWFSGGEQLLADDGKVAFLFAGFNMDTGTEVDTVADYFDLEHVRDMAEHGLLNHSLKLYHTNTLIDASLKKLGITPDMNAGHSIGEWHAGRAAGLIGEDNVKAMMEAWVRDLDMEIGDDSRGPDENFDSGLEDVYFVAVGCGYKELEPIVRDIPELHLSNDNCPTQVMMCGRREAVDEMARRLKEQQIFCQELPYKSGYHTPFIAGHVDILDYCMAQITELREPEIPLWSATSLERYPTDMEEYRKLTFKHLTSHIRFRELVEKLYEQEGARVFVQIGPGPLTGFVDDTLHGRNYSAIQTCHPGRSGIEQLRRVLALLYIEGKTVDTLFVRNGEISKVIGQELEIEGFIPFVDDFPLVREALKKQSRFYLSSVGSGDADGGGFSQLVGENMREMALAQKEMSDAMDEVRELEKRFGLADLSRPEQEKKAKPAAVPVAAPAAAVPAARTGAFTDEVVITTRDYPFIVDHTVVKQPEGWPVVEDLDVVIPMTMSIEMMMEIASRHAPSGKKVTGLAAFSIFQWMNVFDEFRLKVEGSPVSEERMKLEMKNFIETEAMLADEYPAPPRKYAGEIDLGRKTHKAPTRDYIYREIMFHGPKYQGIVEVTGIHEHGMTATVRDAGGKGSLLDTLGQLIGVYLRTVARENNVCFPVSVGRITFYGDFHDTAGEFDFTLVTTEINDEFVNGDMILRRDGRVWCVAENWLNRRFEMDDALWDVINKPTGNRLAKPLEGTPLFYFDLAYSKTGSWPFIEKRYLGREEKERLKELLLNRRRPYIISRIAAKDAVRASILEKYGRTSFPIEIVIDHDAAGKPIVRGPEEVGGLNISISHKENESVAFVGEKPLGVDIERIGERSADFMELSFTPRERALIAGRNEAEWSTRLWTAKEAYGKMLGRGLEGNPLKYETERIDGETLFIGGMEIHTTKHKEKYIVAWTQQL